MTKKTTAAFASLFAVGLLTALALPAFAQDAAPVDQALLQKGATLYSNNCAACHQQAGTGTPPDFPALAGDTKLSDLSLIVTNIHSGKGAMPPFPDLTADDIAALATYVRNTWGNAFGGATPEEVTTLLASAAPADTAAAGASIWTGIYTEDQATRGASTLAGSCAKCHGTRLNGAGDPDQLPSPAIARSGFLKKWEGRTLEALFTYIHTKMPLDNPGQLTDAQVADVIAQMLKVSNVPAGSAELPPDPAALGGIVIKEKAD
jgi:mono/diheme cytochrome c family protein